MRTLALWLAFLVVCAPALPILAQDDDSDEDSSAWSEYRDEIVNRNLMGLNSILTFPADPVMSTIHPDAEFEKLPLGKFVKWPIGLFQGILLMAYRAGNGVLDVAFAEITPMKMLSPEPRYMIFPGVEHEEY